ncbi:MAG: hypothetical protein RL154_480 [Pseudomonadota bacterium]
MAKKILIVDDSALVRKQLSEVIGGAGYDFEFAKNGAEAVEKALSTNYDAITMDINMPVLDGISAVIKIMQANPTPIMMVSSLTTEDAPTTLDALDAGALDFIAKPGTFNIKPEEMAEDILRKLRSITLVPKSRLKGRSVARQTQIRDTKSDAVKTASTAPISKIVLIGSSTGGPKLIEDICAALPADYPNAVCVVQHMPEKFTASFANRLNAASKLLVKESEHNEDLKAGVVYIAKGGTHLNFAKKVSGKITLRHEPTSKTKRFFTPSVDEMFLSALTTLDPKKITAVELTGIGDDGADGMVALKKAGAHTIGESEETATVYGMPKEAFLRGGVIEQLPFPKILRSLAQLR